jgi:hypothetical protein
MMGLIDSSCGGSFRGFQEAKSVCSSGFGGDGRSGSLKSKLELSSIAGWYVRRGGVGDRRLNFFWLRCRDLRERIEPAQDLTFFCFLLGFLDIEDLLDVDASIDGMSTSCATISGDDGAVSSFLDSFPEDALVGRDFGDDSPEPVGPKNDHFFADRGVDGVGLEAAATSESRGRDERLLGVGSSALDTS